MDPQIKMMLTTIGGMAATAIAGWAASKGFISAGDQAGLASALVTVGGTAVGAALVWYAHRQTSQKSMITAINQGDNGVKVVPTASTNVPPVSGPVK